MSMLRTVSSLDGLRLSPQPPVQWGIGACPVRAAITVRSDELHQTIGGFGASMLEAGAINLNSLPATKQKELLELLFGPSGARLSAMKATMLSNDFSAAAAWSTYDDVAKDTLLSHFSLARDLQPNGSLTFIKRAIAAGFEGTIQAYMDFPPDWMLTHAPTKEDHGRIAPKFYDVLANYFARYVQGYATHGVRIDFLEAFNEPRDSYVNETADTLATILGDHLGPTFERLGLWPNHTRLTYGGQCSRQSAGDMIPRVLAHPSAARFTDVLAYHGYDCQYEDDGSCTDARQRYDAIAQLAARFPGRPLWMTEVCYAYNGDGAHAPSCPRRVPQAAHDRPRRLAGLQLPGVLVPYTHALCTRERFAADCCLPPSPLTFAPLSPSLTVSHLRIPAPRCAQIPTAHTRRQ